MSLVIRHASATDLPAITRIYNEAVIERIATADTTQRSLEDRAEWFRQFNDRFPIWVGTHQDTGDEVVAYGVLYQYSPRDGYRYAAENGVYVARAVRGKGYGRVMLKHVVLEARRIGFRYVLAKIFSHNEPSLKLHAELGFNDLGLQKNIVEMDGRWYDVMLMDLRM